MFADRRARVTLSIRASIAAAVVAVAGFAGAGGAANAVPVPGGPDFATIMDGFGVNGNLTSAGNGLLTCGTACTFHASGSPGNNGLIMSYVDVDSDPSTFNSSSARLVIPAGATVAKAWLMWQANGWAPPRTATNGLCATSATGAVLQSRDAVLASEPRISVDGGGYQNVGIADYTSFSAVSTNWLINGATDVTDQLAGLGGGTHTLTVANLVASQGTGCVAGWSLHVAYDYGGYIVGNPDSARRLLYTGFGSIVVFQANQTVTFKGFRTASPGATLLLTVGDGEAPAGDRARLQWVGGFEQLANPTGSTTNMFNSIMDGAISYANPPDATFHNGSLDTYQTRSISLPTGSTQAEFLFQSTTDGFYAHSVSMAVEVAQLRVTKLPGTGDTDAQIASAGQTPEYRIILSNDSAVAISSLEFDDANAANCSLNGVPLVRDGITYAVPDLAAGTEATVQCVGPVVADGDPSYANTATARGLDPNGASVGPISDTTQVLVPHISLTKTATPVVIVSGETATWTMQVTNDGGTDLRNVSLTDTACAGAVSPPTGPGAPTVLAQGTTWTYSCSEALTADKTNTASVTADSFATVGGEELTGGAVSDSDEATVTVTAEPTPHLTVAKSVSDAVVDSGDTVTWTIEVLNDGSTDLENVVVADTDCAGSLSAPAGPGAPTVLGIGATWTYTCSETVTADKTNTAEATADSFRIINGVHTPGPAVSGGDDAFVQVAPLAHLTVEKTVDQPSVTAGGTVTWSIAATNDGDADLRNVMVSDPDCTGTLSAPTGPGAPTLLSVGSTWTYTCAEVVTADKTNTASVTGESFRVVNGIDFVGPTATDSDAADVIVVADAHITLTKVADREAVTVGDIVTWTITAVNDGEADLRDVSVTDTGCNGALDGPVGPGAPNTLAAGDTWTYTCAEPVTADKSNTAVVVGQSFRSIDGIVYTGEEVSSTDSAEVFAFAPARLTLQKEVDRPVVAVGDDVTWTITATNDGEADLHDVEVTDTACDGAVSAPSGPGAPDVLAAGDSWTYTCTETLSQSKTNTAVVTARSFRETDGDTIEGITVSASGSAQVTVTPGGSPPLAVTGLAGSAMSWYAASAAILLLSGAIALRAARRGRSRSR